MLFFSLLGSGLKKQTIFFLVCQVCIGVGALYSRYPSFPSIFLFCFVSETHLISFTYLALPDRCSILYLSFQGQVSTPQKTSTDKSQRNISIE